MSNPHGRNNGRTRENNGRKEQIRKWLDQNIFDIVGNLLSEVRQPQGKASCLSNGFR